MDDVLLRTSPEYKEFRQEILRAIHLLDTSIAAHRPTIVTESYLTGEEVMELFSLCPRTLQNYRDRRVLPYTTIGSKILYPRSEIEKILNRNYRKSLVGRPPGKGAPCFSRDIAAVQFQRGGCSTDHCDVPVGRGSIPAGRLYPEEP